MKWDATIRFEEAAKGSGFRSVWVLTLQGLVQGNAMLTANGMEAHPDFGWFGNFGRGNLQIEIFVPILRVTTPHIG